jgi:hypothetical protein
VTGPSEPTGEQPAEPRRWWSVIPRHLGRARTSTVVIGLLFVALFALYLNVRPDPEVPAGATGGDTDVTEPAPTTGGTTPPPVPEPTTTPPPSTVEEPTTTEDTTTTVPEDTTVPPEPTETVPAPTTDTTSVPPLPTTSEPTG